MSASSQPDIRLLSCCNLSPNQPPLSPRHSLTAFSAHTRIRVSLCTNVHLGRSSLVRPRRINQPLLDVARQRVEGLVDIDVALSRDLQERDAEFVGEGLALFCGDGALLFPVALVADEDLVDAFRGVLLDVGEPCADVCYCLLASPSPYLPSMYPRGNTLLLREWGDVLLKLLSSVTS
jgi:hypothetical protein